MPPQVRDLQTLIAQQQAALQPQFNVIDQDIQTTDNLGTAQVAGLNALKDQAFGQIEQGAQNKGMFFSGVAPAEQAGYVGGTYLPELAKLQATIAQARTNLFGKKADLSKTAFDVATQQQENDRQVLNDWNKMTAQQQFQASQAEKDRVFTAQQNAQNRSAAAPKPPTQAQIFQGAVADMGGAISQKVGRDGYVSPSVYNRYKQEWVKAGFASSSFDSSFSAFRNPKNTAYNLGKPSL